MTQSTYSLAASIELMQQATQSFNSSPFNEYVRATAEIQKILSPTLTQLQSINNSMAGFKETFASLNNTIRNIKLVTNAIPLKEIKRTTKIVQQFNKPLISTQRSWQLISPVVLELNFPTKETAFENSLPSSKAMVDSIRSAASASKDLETKSKLSSLANEMDDHPEQVLQRFHTKIMETTTGSLLLLKFIYIESARQINKKFATIALASAKEPILQSFYFARTLDILFNIMDLYQMFTGPITPIDVCKLLIAIYLLICDTLLLK